MPLESTIVCLDISQWMRNGDYAPNRIDAQYDAATMLCGSKLDQNPESTVGLLTTGGGGIKLLTSPTEDLGKLLASLHGLRPEGASNLVGAIKTAMIALKHRKNKHGGQRIITFVGSPVEGPREEDLRKLGATLKKNNIALDVISLGEPDLNTQKLQALVDAANNSDNSHLLSVPAGVLPSDVLSTSPIMLGDFGAFGAPEAGGGAGGAPAAGAGGGHRFDEYGGVDPSMDPELAMVMRISMEEARARTEARDSADPAAASSPVAAGSPPASSSSAAAAVPASAGMALFTPSPLAAGSSSAAAAPPSAAAGGVGDVSMGGLEMSDEDALLQQALSLSMAESAESAAVAPIAAAAPAAAPVAPAAAGAGAFTDMSFVESLLGGLPGVDINDPAIQEAMRALQQGGAGSGGPPPQPPKEEEKK